MSANYPEQVARGVVPTEAAPSSSFSPATMVRGAGRRMLDDHEVGQWSREVDKVVDTTSWLQGADNLLEALQDPEADPAVLAEQALAILDIRREALAEMARYLGDLYVGGHERGTEGLERYAQDSGEHAAEELKRADERFNREIDNMARNYDEEMKELSRQQEQLNHAVVVLEKLRIPYTPLNEDITRIKEEIAHTRHQLAAMVQTRDEADAEIKRREEADAEIKRRESGEPRWDKSTKDLSDMFYGATRGVYGLGAQASSLESELEQKGENEAPLREQVRQVLQEILNVAPLEKGEDVDKFFEGKEGLIPDSSSMTLPLWVERRIRTGSRIVEGMKDKSINDIETQAVAATIEAAVKACRARSSRLDTKRKESTDEFTTLGLDLNQRYWNSIVSQVRMFAQVASDDIAARERAAVKHDRDHTSARRLIDDAGVGIDQVWAELTSRLLEYSTVQARLELLEGIIRSRQGLVGHYEERQQTAQQLAAERAGEIEDERRKVTTELDGMHGGPAMTTSLPVHVQRLEQWAVESADSTIRMMASSQSLRGAQEDARALGRIITQDSATIGELSGEHAATASILGRRGEEMLAYLRDNYHVAIPEMQEVVRLLQLAAVREQAAELDFRATQRALEQRGAERLRNRTAAEAMGAVSTAVSAAEGEGAGYEEDVTPQKVGVIRRALQRFLKS